MKISLLALLTICLFCTLVAQSYAAMYRWVDEKGHVWITDYPDPRTAKKHEQEVNTTNSKRSTDLVASESASDQSAKIRVIPGISSLAEVMRKHAPHFMEVWILSNISASEYTMIADFVAVFVIAFYIHGCLCLYMIARKFRVSYPWSALIPAVNVWTFVETAGKPWWWTVIIAVLLLSTAFQIGVIISSLLSICVAIYLWMCISEKAGKNRWLGLLMLIPIINFFYSAVLAFSRLESFNNTIYSSDITSDRS